MSSAPPDRLSLTTLLAVIGPGLAVAATGIGAGDVVTAAAGGARYGTAILWAAVIGALVKGALNEGIARWQLATGTTLLEGWGRHLAPPVVYAFGLYLVLWTFMVAGALMAACGLAANALVPAVPVAVWGALHAVVAAGLVYLGRYELFERLIKGFIALMFVTVLASAILVAPDLGAVAAGLVVPSVPTGSGPFLLGVIGGVGGSVTLMSYSYWIQERGWSGPAFLRTARIDLTVAYALTGIFGVAIMVVAAGVPAAEATGTALAVELANQIRASAGAAAGWIFLVGFWGAVFTSMLGVWQGVPYLFVDFIRTVRNRPDAVVTTTSPLYRGYLLFIAGPPMLLLLADRPVWIVVIYAIAGSLFMPFLAGTLLYLNNRQAWVGPLRNRWVANTLLVVALLLFGYLAFGS